jgi:putative hydrolase
MGEAQNDPTAALNEIAFWLERERAQPFKVQAFRRAAAALADLSSDDIATQARTGRLKSRKGIGATSFDVIRQAVEGDVPDYLQKVRDRNTTELSKEGAALLKLLVGDLHTHSEWSDGTTPIEAMVDAARLLGREYIALTDHSPSLTIANGLSGERLEQELEVVAGINKSSGSSSGKGSGTGSASFTLLSGIEVDILESGELDQTPELLERLDIVVASVHSKLRADSRTMTARMLGGIENPFTTVLGHCTGRMIEGRRGDRPQSDFDAARVFAACVENNVAVEINSRPERQDPPDDLIAKALDAGCLFSINTDAHAPGHLSFLDLGAERAAANGVPADRIITTWPRERLLEWARSNR